jgi:hypothetical protein
VSTSTFDRRLNVVLMRIPLVLTLVIVAVLTFGLLYTLKKNIVVAPWAAEGQEGRLHFHSKNVTRVGGSPGEVARAIQRAVFLADEGAPAPVYAWRETLSRMLRPLPDARHGVVLPSEGEEADRWALPGAYWAAYARVPVFFAGGDEIPENVRAELRERKLPLYVVAPRDLVSDAVLNQLRASGPVTRVAGSDLASHAVLVAEYRDQTTGFGWGRTHDRRTGYFEYVIAAPSDAAAAWAALPLARSNAATFLFAADDGGLPGATDRYVWSQRADWFVTPAEGPFRHMWIVGDRVSYAAHGRLDLAPEKSPYLSLGEPALGPMEALLLVFIVFGIAGAMFVAVHGRRLLPDVMAPQRIAWILTALLLPILGVLLYLAAYRRPRVTHERMPHWIRPSSIQAAAATAMGFGYGAPLMIVIGYAFVYFGFPLFFGEWANGWVFAAGAGMPLMMTGMYVLAVLVAWPLAQMPMAAMMQSAGPREVAWRTLGVTALSMAAVSLGMMTTAWWMLMAHSPMMPKEDQILWFGSMWLASTIGFLIAWPLNWPMVRARLKSGAM